MITSPLEFNRSTTAPLAGTLRLETDVPSRVTVSVSAGKESWKRNFLGYNTAHEVPLFGFKPGRLYDITVTVRDRFQNEFTTETPLKFFADALPQDFPVINVRVSKPDQMEPGYTLFRSANTGRQTAYLIMLDNLGEVVWYSSLGTGSDIRMLDNGNIFTPLPASFLEINLLGEAVKSWLVPGSLDVDTHDGFLTDRQSLLYIHNESRNVPNFPTNANDPAAPKQTARVQFNRIIELSATNQAVLNDWALADMLDPHRITYLTYTQTSDGWDAHHGNAIIEDPRDNSIIVSLRNQNAVVSFSRLTGQLKWILGPHENWGPEFKKYLLKPVGTSFQWNYAQHAPSITPSGTLLLYDNGNVRASPFDFRVSDDLNYSRAVEYEINEQTMEVRQVWEYGPGIEQPLYTPAVGCARWLPQTGHVLVDFGMVTYVDHERINPASPNATLARIQEVTHEANPEVVFDLEIFDYDNRSSGYLGHWVYRAFRVLDLYGHPILPVTDLQVDMDGDQAFLQFSGDPVRSYVVEATTDLVNWEIVTTLQPNEDGLCTFEDQGSLSVPGLFYRIRTQ